MQTFPKNLVGLRNGVGAGVFVGDAFFAGDFLKKVPHTPPKLPKNGIGTHGRKGEQRAAFFCAEKGSFRSPILQYKLGFLPLSLIDFFEASPYGVLADRGDSSSTAAAVPLLPQEKASVCALL